MTEDQILAKAVMEIHNTMPETRYCFYHIANEGKRSVMEWAQLKAKGFVAGIQDLHFIFGGHIYLIEMKDEKGYVQPDQKVVHCAHFNQGIPTYIFRDPETLIGFVKDVVTKGHSFATNKYKKFISPFCLPKTELPRLIKEARETKSKRYGRK